MSDKNKSDPGSSKFQEILKVNLKLIERLEKENLKLRHDLNERIKELTGNYDIERIVDTYGSFDELMQAIADVIPPAYQYPEVTCARIVLRGVEYRTGNFKATGWKQESVIRIDGRPEGSVEVYYTEARPESDEGPFMSEERKLINKMALRIGKIAEKMDATEALRKSEDRLSMKTVIIPMSARR